MIFVTVSGFKFERLVKKMDEIAGRLKERVVMQTGLTSYKPRNAKYSKYIDPSRLAKAIESSRLVVSHGGAGSIIDALKSGKPLIVVPRKKEFGECSSDHQLQLARQLEREGLAEAVYDVEGLEEKIKSMPKRRRAYKSSERKKLINFLNDYLRGLCEQTTQ